MNNTNLYHYIVTITREFDGDTYEDEYSGVYHDDYETAKEEYREAESYFPGCATISFRFKE